MFSIPIACMRPVIHMKRKVLVALGGNAILKHKEKGTVDEQFENIRTTCKHLVRIIKDGYKIAIIKEIKPVDPVNCDYKNLSGVIPDISYDDTEIKKYDAENYKPVYSKSFILPRIFFDYGKPKFGIYSYKNDVLDKYNLFWGASLNKDFDHDLFGIFEYKIIKPTIFLELYSLRRSAEFYFPLWRYDVKYSLLESDIGFSLKINEIMF